MKLHLSILLAFVLLFSRCVEEEKKKKPVAIGENLSEQIFNITAGIDTILVSEKGAKIFISKNTFTTNVDAIEIKLKEALTLAEMVKAGLTTTSDNKILSSGGMIYISATWNGKKIQLLNPIKIQIPADNFDEGMKLFKGEIADNKINWSLAGDLDNYVKSPFERGKKIFEYYCVACHKNGQVLIGPDLIGITKRQNKEWIYAFTRNSQAVINSGDIYAKSLFEKYNKVIMPPQNLTDAQLDDLYYFIENDMQAISLLLPASPNSIFSASDTGASNSGADSARKDFNTGFARDSSYYLFSVQGFGWYNCDKFIDESNTVAPEITVNFKDKKPANGIVIVLPKLKSVISTGLSENKLQISQLPKNEKAVLVFTNYTDGEPKYFYKTLTINEQPVTIHVDDFNKSYKDLESVLK
ncbi:MAG: c-type cytochrome [Bacteroidia bacterium]